MVSKPSGNVINHIMELSGLSDEKLLNNYVVKQSILDLNSVRQLL